jgi:ketosteroid isomerase-like protein
VRNQDDRERLHHPWKRARMASGHLGRLGRIAVGLEVRLGRVPMKKTVEKPNRMWRVLPAAMVALMMLATGARAQKAPDGAELTKLLREFLAGASRDDAAMHDRFWAEDLIYTGSSGRRIGKADIMREVRSAPAPKAEDPKTTYSAADIRIQQYGDAAIVAFRLIGTTEKDGTETASNWLNTGTFLKRDDQWRAVSWQATRVPPVEEEARKQVAAAESTFHRAILTLDLKRLEALMDENFIWTRHAGEQITRRQLLDQLRSGDIEQTIILGAHGPRRLHIIMVGETRASGG